MCQFRIGSDPKEMKVLQPRDIKTEADGKFPCGRNNGFEQKEFRMPSSECLNCMIELEYTYNNTMSIKQCSDITVM